MPGEKDFQDTTLTNTQGPCRNSCFYQDSEPTASTVVRGESTVSTATSPVESIAPGEPTVPGEPKASVAVEAGQAVKVVPAGQAIETVNQAVKLNSFFSKSRFGWCSVCCSSVE